MLYGYDAYDEWLAWARSTQPLPVSAAPTIHPDSTAVQLGITPEEMGQILEDQAEWMREEEEEERIIEGHTRAEENHHHQQVRDDETDKRAPPMPLKYTYSTAHDTAHDDDAYGILFEHHDEPNDGTVCAEPDRNAIEPLERKLNIPGHTEVDWAEELDEEMGFNIQGEYMPASYPPAPSPTPWYPPPPPTTRHRCPRANYTPNHSWYNPPRAPYMP